MDIITPEKKKELQKELQELIDVKRPRVLEDLNVARSFGDLSENAEYDAARQEQQTLESRVKEIEFILNNAEVVAKKTKSDGTVSIGSKVEVEIDGKKEEYIMVGKDEADILSNKITNESPIGSVLYGKEEGASGTIVLPTKNVKFKITAVK